MKGTKTTTRGLGILCEIMCRLSLSTLWIWFVAGYLFPNPSQKPQPIAMHHIFNVLFVITPLR